MRYESCRNRLTITLYQQLDKYTIIRVSDRLPSFQNNTIYLSNTITIDQYIWVSGYSPDSLHNITLYTTTTRLPPSRTPERLPTFSCHCRARHQSGASHPQQHEVAMDYDIIMQYLSHHCGPYKYIYIVRS